MVQKFINELSEAGLAPKTVDGIYATLKPALEQAVINGLIPKNPTLHVNLPKWERAPIRVLTLEEQERFIKEAKNTLYGEILIIALCTGLRIGDG